MYGSTKGILRACFFLTTRVTGSGERAGSFSRITFCRSIFAFLLPTTKEVMMIERKIPTTTVTTFGIGRKRHPAVMASTVRSTLTRRVSLNQYSSVSSKDCRLMGLFMCNLVLPHTTDSLKFCQTRDFCQGAPLQEGQALLLCLFW